MIALAPCPFCGDHARYGFGGNSSDERYGYNFTAFVECRGCSARAGVQSLSDKNGWCVEDRDAAAHRAALLWNRREG